MKYRPEWLVVLFVLAWPRLACAQDVDPFEVPRKPPPSVPREPGELKPSGFFPAGRDGSVWVENIPPSVNGGTIVMPTEPEAASGAAAGGQGQAEGGGEGGGDNGTNPASNSKTAIIVNEFYRLDGGNEINTVYVRLKFPILEKRGALLIEAPYKWYDITAPISGEVGGLGDVKLQLTYNACVSEDRQWTLITFLEMFIPSADTALLAVIPDANQFTALNVGSGKYVLGPGLGVVYAAAPNFIIAPLYFYEGSVAGDDNRPDISRGKFRFFMMYALPSGLYALPEFQLVTNFKTWNNDAYAAPEIGYSTKGSTFYIKPGVGIAPDTNDRAWGIEFGLRVLF